MGYFQVSFAIDFFFPQEQYWFQTVIAEKKAVKWEINIKMKN